MADQLSKFKTEVDALIDGGTIKEEAIFIVVKKYIIESKNIRFEGNSYSKEWEDEAIKRGLSNYPSTPEALKCFYI